MAGKPTPRFGGPDAARGRPAGTAGPAGPRLDKLVGPAPGPARPAQAALRPAPGNQSWHLTGRRGGYAPAGRAARGIPAARRERVAGFPPGRASGPAPSVRAAHQRVAGRTRRLRPPGPTRCAGRGRPGHRPRGGELVAASEPNSAPARRLARAGVRGWSCGGRRLAPVRTLAGRTRRNGGAGASLRSLRRSDAALARLRKLRRARWRPRSWRPAFAARPAVPRAGEPVSAVQAVRGGALRAPPGWRDHVR